MSRVVTYTAFSLAGWALVISIGRIFQARPGSSRVLDRPRWLPISDTAFRGLLRMRPMAGATVVVVLMVAILGSLIKSSETNPLGGPAPSWIALPGLAGILTGLIVCFGIVLFNRPRWVVPAAFRNDRGALFEWRGDRQRWRDELRRASHGSVLAGAIPRFALSWFVGGVIALGLAPVRGVIWSFALGVAAQGLYLLITHPLVTRPGRSGSFPLIGEQFWPLALLAVGVAMPVDSSWPMISAVGALSLHVEADWIRRSERRRLAKARPNVHNKSLPDV